MSKPDFQSTVQPKNNAHGRTSSCGPRKNFFLRPQEEVLAADCGSLELESWKPQELLCFYVIEAQELLCSRMFEPQELLCGSLQFFAVTL